MFRVIEGPADCANPFGYWKRGLLVAGSFAVVEDGELANGGRGPILCGGVNVFDDRESAQHRADECNHSDISMQGAAK